MKLKIRKFVYELSQNSRLKTKDLGKKLKISQQSASYLIQSWLKKRTILNYGTIIDPAKFGLLQVLVYLNYTDFNHKKIKEVINYLKENDYVVQIEDLKQGYDLAVVFCVPNLSLYNKLVWVFLQKFKKTVLLAETYPIVVKHIYTRKYLSNYRKYSEVIISGDRDVYNINGNEKNILRLLADDPAISIVQLHKKTGLNPKTIIRLKKKLESNKVIRNYSTNFNLDRFGIEKKHLLISSASMKLIDDKRILQFALTHPNIVSLTRIIGNYDILIEFEDDTMKNNVLKDLRTNFSISKYRIIEGGNLIKDKYIPPQVLEA